MGHRPCANGPVFLHAVAQTSLSNKTLAIKNTTAFYLTWKKADARRHLGIETREYTELRSLAAEPPGMKDHGWSQNTLEK